MLPNWRVKFLIKVRRNTQALASFITAARNIATRN